MSDKREKILEAALKLFTEKGIDSTSTGSIAKEAGIATGTVFNYFSNKEELIKECFINVKKRLREGLGGIESDDFVEQTKFYWKAAIEWFLDHTIETSFINMYQHDPKVNNGTSLSVITEMSKLIMAFFEQARAEGILKDFSVEYFCLLANDSTILAAQFLAENPDVDKEKFIESTCSFFLDGVLNK